MDNIKNFPDHSEKAWRGIVNFSPPQLLLDQSYMDVGHLGRTVGWDWDFRQLDTGKLYARAIAIGGHNVQVIKFQLSRGFHQLGCAPDGMLTFGVVGPGVPDFKWSSRNLSGGSLLNFNMQSGFDGVSLAGFTGYTVILRPQYLQFLAEQMDISTPVEYLSADRIGWFSQRTVMLGKKLDTIYRKISRLGTRVLNEYSEIINEEIGFTILGELTGKTERSQPYATVNKTIILRNALKILNDPDRLPITVAKLRELVGVSSSSLNRIFLSEYGVPPKSYIRSRCLSAARDALACSSPKTKVSDIANRWGFWHMGQFARDYRRMFGELPSDTFKRNH